jgi:hypothetical protein
LSLLKHSTIQENDIFFLMKTRCVCVCSVIVASYLPVPALVLTYFRDEKCESIIYLFETGSHYVAQADFKFSVLLFLSPKC